MVASACASPYDRNILSAGRGDHRWGVYEWVDVPTGDPFEPMCNVVVFGLGQDRSWKVLSYSGSIVSRFVGIHLVAFTLIFSLVGIYGIGRRWNRFKLFKLTAIFFASACILGLCYLSYWIGGGRLRYASKGSDGRLLSCKEYRLSNAIRTLNHQNDSNNEAITDDAIFNIQDSLREIAGILGKNDYSILCYEDIWSDLLNIESLIQKNLLPINAARERYILDSVIRIKEYLNNKYPEQTLAWTRNRIAVYPDAIHFHADVLPDVDELVKQKRHWPYSYMYTRACAPASQVTRLHDMLQDIQYQPHWHNIAIILSIISDDSNSVPLLIDYIKQPETAPLAAHKIYCLFYLGKHGGAVAKDVLMSYVTIEGAQDLAEALIESVMNTDKTGLKNEEDLIRFIYLNAIRGLPFLRDDEVDSFIDDLYTRKLNNQLNTNDPNIPIHYLAEAMGIKDFVKDYGIEQMYCLWECGDPTGKFRPYRKKYTVEQE